MCKGFFQLEVIQQCDTHGCFWPWIVFLLCKFWSKLMQIGFWLKMMLLLGSHLFKLFISWNLIEIKKTTNYPTHVPSLKTALVFLQVGLKFFKNPYQLMWAIPNLCALNDWLRLTSSSLKKLYWTRRYWIRSHHWWHLDNKY